MIGHAMRTSRYVQRLPRGSGSPMNPAATKSPAIPMRNEWVDVLTAE